MSDRTPHRRMLIFTATGLLALLAILAVFLPGYRLLMAFLLYTATLNSGLIPFPTMTFALFLGKSHSPFLVAAVGTAGSAVASVIVYYLMVKLSKKKSMRRIENSRLVQSWKALARRSPFLSLAVFNTIPFPADPSRFFAIFNRYSVGKYVLAISIGRFIRYSLLAALGGTFRIPNSILIAATVALIVFPLAVRKCKGQTERSRNYGGSLAVRRAGN